ncbi:transposable element Tc1 transposase [Trichonephila clavipes]|nr:transposable element Tc1 transposase [Trichonephila clavipes]
MLPWLVRSPDLSPIENAWDIIGWQLQDPRLPALTVLVLTQAQQAWNSISQSDTTHLYDTMHARLHSKFWSQKEPKKQKMFSIFPSFHGGLTAQSGPWSFQEAFYNTPFFLLVLVLKTRRYFFRPSIHVRFGLSFLLGPIVSNVRFFIRLIELEISSSSRSIFLNSSKDKSWVVVAQWLGYRTMAGMS